MIRRAFLFSLALVALFAVPAAVAQEYDGGSAETTITDEVIIVNAEGFIPGATVTYEVDYTAFGDDENAFGVFGAYEGEIAFAMPVAAPMVIVETGTTTADANGNVDFAVTNRGEGRYEIRMTDGVNTVVAVAAVGEPGDGGATDGDADERAAGDLPKTGSDGPIGLAQVGITAVALGAVAVYAAKRRRATAWSA